MIRKSDYELFVTDTGIAEVPYKNGTVIVRNFDEATEMIERNFPNVITISDASYGNNLIEWIETNSAIKENLNGH